MDSSAARDGKVSVHHRPDIDDHDVSDYEGHGEERHQESAENLQDVISCLPSMAIQVTTTRTIRPTRASMSILTVERLGKVRRE